MRRIILLAIAFVFPMAAYAYNESVAAISFNPSRLGAYNYLKAVNTATLRGGISVGPEQLYINSTGTVTLQDNNHSCRVESGNCEGDNLNTITTIVPLASVAEKCPACTSSTHADTSAVVQGIDAANGAPQSSYTFPNDLNSSAFKIQDSTVVNMRGGTFTADGDSYIHNLYDSSESGNQDKLKTLTVGARQINVMGILQVNDSMKLGNITIKKPLTGPNGKSYKFVERTTKDKKTVKVLAVEK